MGITLTNPYVARANEYQGQLHFHSDESDGVDTPTAIVTAYKNAGYDFVSLTDHDVVTADPSVSDILFIPGVEETTSLGHIGGVNVTTGYAFGLPQIAIDGILADGGIPIMAHPERTDALAWTDAELALIHGYIAYEVYSPYNHSSAEARWDRVLSKGVRVHGVAVDDCHDIAGAFFDNGWVQAFADSLTETNIVAALKAGNFYSSTGPNLTMSVSGNVITATTSSAGTIAFIGNDGTILQTTASATTASYTAKRTDIYVRVKITRDLDGKFAWSNPIWVTYSSTRQMSRPWLSRCPKKELGQWEHREPRWWW